MIVDGELVIEIDPAAPMHGAKELLAIGADYAGVRHALYPTACRTLCSMSTDEKIADVDAGDDGGPDCLVCATAAAAFDKIDRSAPSTWFRRTEAEAA